MTRAGERGSITVFFLLIVAAIGGALAYSLYVGRAVEQKIKVANAADIVALSMARHDAMGLNMIAANNLAIGAELHVAASVPFIGQYYAVVRALLLSAPGDWPKLRELASPDAADASDFADGFKYTRRVTELFVRSAAGLTALNHKIATYWVAMTPIKGLEQLRLNLPGGVGLPVQVSKAGSMATALRFERPFLKQTSADHATCHAIKASGAPGISDTDRNKVVKWLGGAITSVTPSAKSLVGALAALETIPAAVGSIIGSAKKAGLDAADEALSGITSATCGNLGNLGSTREGRKKRRRANRICKEKDELPGLMDSIASPPFPRFDGCGLVNGYSFGKQMRGYAGADAALLHSIGFIYPDIETPAELKRYEESLEHAILAGMPTYLRDELPSTDTCPEPFRYAMDGRTYCSLPLGGADFGAAAILATPTHDHDAASGGVALATGKRGGAKGALHDAWKRTQWAATQAAAVYEPDASQHDPRHADTRAGGDVLSKRRMQLFWPAWQARNVKVEIQDKLLGVLTPRVPSLPATP